MKSHTLYARELFEQGYNCAQAVFGAWAQDLGMDMETALKLSSSLGGGLGKLREVCGAVSGAAMVLGVKYGYTSPKDDKAKADHYQLIQNYAGKFREKHDSFICRDLLGLDGAGNPIPDARTKQYYDARPCASLVESAAQILDEMIESMDNKA